MTPPQTKPIAERLRAGADDPMWADHSEFPKRYLKEAADTIDALVDALEGLLDSGFLWDVQDEPPVANASAAIQRARGET